MFGRWKKRPVEPISNIREPVATIIAHMKSRPETFEILSYTEEARDTAPTPTFKDRTRRLLVHVLRDTLTDFILYNTRTINEPSTYTMYLDRSSNHPWMNVDERKALAKARDSLVDWQRMKKHEQARQKVLKMYE